MGIREIRISAGIIRSSFWLRILADVLDATLQVPRTTNLGVFGGALNAATGAEFYAEFYIDYKQAAEFMLIIIRRSEN